MWRISAMRLSSSLTACRPSWRILARSPSASCFFRNHSWCCLSVTLDVQRVVLGRHLGLLFQLVEVGVQLAQDVFYARQVLARVAQAVFGLAAALLVLGHAGRFFQEQAQLLGARLDDAADGALADDGVGARAQAGAQEHVLHIAAAHRLVVDEVTAVCQSRVSTRLTAISCELAPLAARAVVAVVEHQLHAGAAGRLAVRRAVEDHVLHALAAQLAGLALTQHPAHGIR